MRRNYISPEFDYIKVNGSLNMIESSSYFGSKMLEIEDQISIAGKSIIYYQKDTHEQIDYLNESKLNPILFDIVGYKSLSHEINLDVTQSEFQKTDKTKWILNISLRDILLNYLFATMKEYRTFEGVYNNMTMYNDVDVAIKNYISSNVIDRYLLKSVDLYIQYKDLKGQNVLKYSNTFLETAQVGGSRLNKIEVFTDYNKNILEVRFDQEKPSSQYAFDYYFNLNFEKI